MSQSEQLRNVPAPPESAMNIPAQMSPEQLTATYSRWETAMKEFGRLAYDMVAQFPEDRSARFFLGEVMQAAGFDDLALEQYEWLRKLQRYGSLAQLAGFAGDITAMCERCRRRFIPTAPGVAGHSAPADRQSAGALCGRLRIDQGVAVVPSGGGRRSLRSYCAPPLSRFVGVKGQG